MYRVGWRGLVGAHTKTFKSREEAQKFAAETPGASAVTQVGGRRRARSARFFDAAEAVIRQGQEYRVTPGENSTASETVIRGKAESAQRVLDMILRGELRAEPHELAAAADRLNSVGGDIDRPVVQRQLEVIQGLALGGLRRRGEKADVGAWKPEPGQRAHLAQGYGYNVEVVKELPSRGDRRIFSLRNLDTGQATWAFEDELRPPFEAHPGDAAKRARARRVAPSEAGR